MVPCANFVLVAPSIIWQFSSRTHSASLLPHLIRKRTSQPLTYFLVLLHFSFQVVIPRLPQASINTFIVISCSKRSVPRPATARLQLLMDCEDTYCRLSTLRGRASAMLPTSTSSWSARESAMCSLQDWRLTSQCKSLCVSSTTAASTCCWLMSAPPATLQGN